MVFVVSFISSWWFPVVCWIVAKRKALLFWVKLYPFNDTHSTRRTPVIGVLLCDITVSGGWHNCFRRVICFQRDLAFFRVDSYIYYICDMTWKPIQKCKLFHQYISVDVFNRNSAKTELRWDCAAWGNINKASLKQYEVNEWKKGIPSEIRLSMITLFLLLLVFISKLNIFSWHWQHNIFYFRDERFTNK